MNSVSRYNALHGRKVTRNDIESIASQAKRERQNNVHTKLTKLLTSNPEAKTFDIQIKNKAKFRVALSTPFDATPFLAGIPYLSPVQEKLVIDPQTAKLAKPVTTEQIYDMITQKMLSMIKEASGKGYQKKWEANVYGKGYLIPFNFVSKKRYRGVNSFLLTGFEPLENPFFLTFKQVDKLGGKVAKGSSGYPVVYFTKLYKVEDKARKIDFGSYDLKKAKTFATENGINHALISYIPILKYYNVFNGADIEGIDFDLENFKIGFIDKELPPTDKMPIAEAIIDHYPKPAPSLKFGGDRASYSPLADSIKMPYMADFETAQDFYRTLFHEFAHSTGAGDRLARDFSGKFGSKKYAFEELIAEWGATFLSAEAGIIFHTNNNHAEYIKNWNSALTHIKDDNKFIMRACSKAQELTDYVLDRDKDGEPKYLKDLKKSVKTKVKKIDEFVKFREIVLKAKNLDDAYFAVSQIKNVPKKVADAFSKKYNPDRMRSPKQAFKVFYEEIKGKPTVASLIKDFVEACKNDLKDADFEATKHKFKAGDQWRSNFDYKGMLTAGTKVTEKTPAATLLKLYNSFSDVNYHTQGGILWEMLELKKEANKLNKTQLALFGKAAKKKASPKKKVTSKPKRQLGSIVIDCSPTQPTADVKNEGLASAGPLGNVPIYETPKEVEQKKETPVVAQVTKSSKNKLSKLQEMGFEIAANGPAEIIDTFVLPGEIGQFIQTIQPHKALILIKGTKHTSKSQLAMQIANAFGEKGDVVAYIDYEQGGLQSKDTLNSRNWNTTEKGRENIAIIGHLEKPFEQLQEFCKVCKVIVADSVTDLQISADQLNELRNNYQDVIWVFISQVKENGAMYGGNKMAHNPTCIIQCHPSDDPKMRYATLEKNRGNDISLAFSIYHKKLIDVDEFLGNIKLPSTMTI